MVLQDNGVGIMEYWNDGIEGIKGIDGLNQRNTNTFTLATTVKKI